MYEDQDLDYLTLKDGPIGCPETSVTYYQTTLRNIPEERRSQTKAYHKPYHKLLKQRISNYLCQIFKYSPLSKNYSVQISKRVSCVQLGCSESDEEVVKTNMLMITTLSFEVLTPVYWRISDAVSLS
jgi:hypothetical protein